MRKIMTSILNECDMSNCCLNELVILPREGEVGFNEYFEHKVNMIMKVKRIFTPVDQNRLMLAYPRPNSADRLVFEKFFESPSIVARNREFEGLFAIDVSDYINKTSDEQFNKLMTYVQQNPQIVFMFMIYSDNTIEIENMFGSIAQYHDVKKTIIELPSGKTIASYVESNIRDFLLHLPKPITEFLNSYFENRAVGYDVADILVRCLKEKNYQGDLDTLKDVISQMEKSQVLKNSSQGFGY